MKIFYDEYGNEEGREYNEEEIKDMKIDFKNKHKCSPEEFILKYDHYTHPLADGLSFMETEIALWEAKFLTSY